MEKVLILYSGGADSRLMLELAKRTNKTPVCLLVNYGQLHHEELSFARNQLNGISVEFHEVSINNLNIESALTGHGDKNMYKGVHSHHVPGRNTMLLSISLSIAEDRGYDKVWIGADFSDRLNLFPDTYQSYIVKMRNIFQIAGSRPIELEAPLMGMSKELVIEMLKSYDVGSKELYSGYGEFS